MNSFYTKFIIFFSAVFMFPMVVFGQATFSSNMSKVEGASDETKERLIKNCNENTDCVGVINQNIFAIANQEIMFTPFPEITELPTEQVEDFASYELQKHLMNSKADTFENSQDFDIEITGWNISNITNMQSMFKGVDNFNQSLHSFHNNAPLENQLDVLQLNATSSTDNNANQKTNEVNTESQASQVQKIDPNLLRKKIRDQARSLDDFIFNYKNELIKNGNSYTMIGAYFYFESFEDELYELSKRISDGNYDTAISRLVSLTNEIENLHTDVTKFLVDRSMLSEDVANSEKWKSLHKKHKDYFSEAKIKSTNLVSESKNFSNLNSEEYEEKIEAFDQSKKSEFINNTRKIEKDVDELENSLRALHQEGIIDMNTYSDISYGSLNFLGNSLRETHKSIYTGILENAKDGGINMLFFKPPGRDSPIEMIQKSQSLAALEKKSKNNPKIKEFLNKFSNVIKDTQKLSEDIIKEDENIQNKIANKNLNNPSTSPVKASGKQLTTDNFKEFIKNNSGVNAVEVGKLIIAFSKNQTNENYQKIIQYLNTVDGFKDFEQSITAQDEINLDEIKKLIDESGLTLDDLKEFLLSNKNVDLSKVGTLVNQYSKDKSLKNFAEAIKYLQSIEGFDKFINDKINKKEETKKALKDKSIADLKEYLQRIDFFIIENLGNEKSEQAIKLSEKIIEVLSSGKVDKIIELKEVANNYLADQEVVEREEIPSAKSTSELASMTDVSTDVNNEDTSQASDKTNEVEASNNQMVEMTGGDGTKSYGFGLLAMNENEKKAEHHVNKDDFNSVIDKNIQNKKNEYSKLFVEQHRHLTDTISHLLHHKLHDAYDDGLSKEMIELLKETLDYYLASSDEMAKELEILLKIYLDEESGDLFNNKDVLNYFINSFALEMVDKSTMRVIEDIILNLVERDIIDGKEFQKLIEDFENYKRFRFSSKNNNDDQLELEIIGMPAPPYWMVEGLTDEEKKEIFKEIKNRINEIYLKPELIGGGPNSIPKLINHYDFIKEMDGDYGDYRTIGLKNQFTELAKNINGGMGLIKESNESTDGENHAHND